MFKLDNEFLQTLGLGGLPVEEKNRLLQMIYERLEMNVGMRLAEKMTDQQLDEFEGFIDRNDEPGALKWLETNFPNYKDVVAEELEKLKGEVQTAAPQILAAHSGTGQQMPPIAQEPMMPGVPQGPMQQPASSPAYGSQSYSPPDAPAQPFQQQPSQYPQPGFQAQQQPYGPVPQPQPMPAAPAPDPAFAPQPQQSPFQQPAPMPPQPPQPTPPPQQPQPQQFTPPPPGYMPGQ